MLDSFEFMVNS